MWPVCDEEIRARVSPVGIGIWGRDRLLTLDRGPVLFDREQELDGIVNI